MIREFLGLDKRATIENPSVSLSDPEAWNDVFGDGMQTASGVSLSHSKSLSLAAVWQAVTMVSGDLAKLPLNVYKRDGDNREKDKSHPAYRLVRRKPNREKPAFQFWRCLSVHFLLWGNAYAYVVRNGRRDPIELLPLLPDRTCPERQDGQLFYVTETEREDGSPWLRPIESENVLHFHGISLDGLKGCDLLQKAKDSWGLALASQNFSAKFFKHGVRAGGVLELPVGMNDKARKNVAEGFQKYHEGEENWFKTVILRDGAKFHQASISPQDGQMIETREEQVREVARWFNLPPSRLGLADSQAYNSKSEDNQNYLETTLAPWLCSVTAECDLKLLSAQQQSADSHFFEHNTNALLRMNPLERYQVYALGLRNRILNRNECRGYENLNPVDGGDEFDEFESSGGTSPGGGSDNQPPDGSGTTKDSPDMDGGDRSSNLQRRVVYRMCDHARKKCRSVSAFIEWLDSGLVSHRQYSVELLGEDLIVLRFIERLNELANNTPETKLVDAVESLCEGFENEN